MCPRQVEGLCAVHQRQLGWQRERQRQLGRQRQSELFGAGGHLGTAHKQGGEIPPFVLLERLDPATQHAAGFVEFGL